MRISHVRLLVPDVTACFLFYRDCMRLEVRYGNEETPYAEFQTGDVSLALEPLLVNAGEETLRRPVAFSAEDRAAIIFSVNDVDAAYEELKGRAVTLVKEPHDTPEWGHRVAYVRDPAGNLIELNGGIS
ncbi:VOC family protein [Paenibacillus sp. R14(2021)]|uniref:VOC family protein n=1 Tax=Paenibacillus sp. R14(2021) TaxID=2859228 RepID=UPI001C614688|nr:VOC family protein [Paenibacillus sp. R14(2021)]